MGFFKKKGEFVDEMLPEISGRTGELEVIIRKMPIKRDILSSKRVLPFSDFGSDLVNVLLYGKKIEYEAVKETLQRSEKFVVDFQIRELPEITLEIRGKLPDKGMYKSDFLDAVLDAWTQNNISKN